MFTRAAVCIPCIVTDIGTGLFCSVFRLIGNLDSVLDLASYTHHYKWEVAGLLLIELSLLSIVSVQSE